MNVKVQLSRAQLRHEGQARRLGLSSALAGELDGLDGVSDELEYGLIWSRPGLAIENRYVAALTAACVLAQSNKLPEFISGALDNGLDPRAICEVFIQSGLYGGIVNAQNAASLAEDVFKQRGVTIAKSSAADESFEEMWDGAVDMRRSLHGARETDGHANPKRRYASQLYEIATLYGYGHIWRRPGLSLKQRLICAVAGMAALPDAPDSFKKFARSAHDNGISVEELQETVIQIVLSIGFPRSLKNLMLMEDLFPDA